MFWCHSVRLAGFVFQACLIDRSSISPFESIICSHEKLTTALLDRLAHHAVVIYGGRLDARQIAQIGQDTE